MTLEEIEDVEFRLNMEWTTRDAMLRLLRDKYKAKTFEESWWEGSPAIKIGSVYIGFYTCGVDGYVVHVEVNSVRPHTPIYCEHTLVAHRDSEAMTMECERVISLIPEAFK